MGGGGGSGPKLAYKKGVLRKTAKIRKKKIKILNAQSRKREQNNNKHNLYILMLYNFLFLFCSHNNKIFKVKKKGREKMLS